MEGYVVERGGGIGVWCVDMPLSVMVMVGGESCCRVFVGCWFGLLLCECWSWSCSVRICLAAIV